MILEKTAETSKQYHRNSTVYDMQNHWLGKLLYKLLMRLAKKEVANSDEKTAAMVQAFVQELPLRNLQMVSMGKFNQTMTNGLIDILNGKWLTGLRKLIFRK